MSNKFAAALKGKPAQTAPVASAPHPEPIVQEEKTERRRAPRNSKTSRDGLKHIGGYFDPVVSKQMRSIALEEEASVQYLLAEALDLLFHSRGKPTIAQKPAQ